jgi:Na+/H+ antiporter NhaC
MRPVTDRLKISREKLAYIVDSTAAPIASIAFVTTWIGAELSYIKEGLLEIGLDQSAYSVFIGSLKYSFYPIFTLAFVLMLILMRRDYGPMLFVERLSTNTNISKSTVNDDIKTTHWINGILPVAVVIIGTIAGLIITGTRDFVPDPALSWFHKISLIIGNADSYVALLWSSLLGALVAVTITISQRLLSVQKTMEALMDGFKSMLPAVVVLIMAWSLAELTSQMKTALFISNVLVNFKMAPWLIPAITFVMSALVAFSTGSSWGTMAILYPLILPVTWLICHNSGLSHEASMAIFYNVVSVVLAGSVMGDHCSPISDTTIMSSLASGCNHISHVKTQMPYALTVGAVALVVGTVPAALGISPFWLFVAGLAVLYMLIRIMAKETTDNN